MSATRHARRDELHQLKEANALLSRFASQAAHDIQEPLRLLAGYLDLIVAHHEGRVAVDASRLAREARDTARRTQDLVTNLLEFARVGGSVEAHEPVALGDALSDALANLRLRVGEAHAEVTHDPLPKIHGDRTALARIFQNLIENSIKHAGKAPVHVHVGARDTDDGWTIDFDDDGAGWPATGRERLFQPFARLRSDDRGSGLGLAMVRVIVERHAGRVEALDSPSGGARVRIILPGSP